MRLLEHSYDAPAQNLALDEVLLDQAESGHIGETLRFWTSPVHFVVLGLSQPLEEHVNREACEAAEVPILRRCSAGGCVLQGPGCLNYSLVLRTDRPGCETIHASYRTILGGIAEALGNLGQFAELAGISDLAIAGCKVSGSAQRRRKHYFLHHGTLLHHLDIGLCPLYLREPAERPEYRGKRDHASFIANIPTDAPPAIRAVSSVFQTQESQVFTQEMQREASDLARIKYSTHAWIFRK